MILLANSLLTVLIWFVLSMVAASPAAADMHGQAMVVRLSTPIASYSPVGTPFKASVIGPVLRQGVDFLPRGSIVTGRVSRAASVRFGLLRERARLDVEFDGCRLPEGTAVDCKVVLEGVDNARAFRKRCGLG